MSDIKILVCGDISGKFDYTFSRISSIQHKKGPFECLLCVGNFFGNDVQEWEKVKLGVIKVPLTTYVLGPCQPEHAKFFTQESGELATNITYLGKNGILSGASGLKIAYMSGVEGNSSGPHTFDHKNVSHLSNNFSNLSCNAVDILLTSQWPHGVTRYAGIPEGVDVANIGSDLISQLAKTLKPRYHFSGLEGFFYERLPYRNHQVLQEVPVHTSRFIGLAPVNNPKKQKWLYAFTLTPMCSMSMQDLTRVIGPVTECPYSFTSSQREKVQIEHTTQFFYETKSANDGSKRKHADRQDSSSIKRRELQAPCWFCLTNPEVQKQLFISIGENSYVTLAKGGLVPDHLLIVPINHHAASVNLPDEVHLEIDQYKLALVQFFNSKGKDVIFFERNYASPHLQIQVVPIPRTLKDKTKEIVLNIAEMHNIQFDEVAKFSSLKQLVPTKKPYFYIEVMSKGEQGAKLLHMINQKFPLQFGRILLADEHLLNVPERIDWKTCNETKQDEIRNREEFRREFKKFDFTEPE